MNRSSIVALVIGAMLFGCGVGMVAHEVMEPGVAEAYEGQKWEYHCETIFIYKEKGKIRLNDLG